MRIVGLERVELALPFFFFFFSPRLRQFQTCRNLSCLRNPGHKPVSLCLSGLGLTATFSPLLPVFRTCGSRNVGISSELSAPSRQKAGALTQRH